MNAKKFSPAVIAFGLPLICPWPAFDWPLAVHIPQVIAVGLPLVVGISPASAVIAFGWPLICPWLAFGLPLVVPLPKPRRKFHFPPFSSSLVRYSKPLTHKLPLSS